jgi:hypothetical protein
MSQTAQWLLVEMLCSVDDREVFKSAPAGNPDFRIIVEGQEIDDVANFVQVAADAIDKEISKEAAALVAIKFDRLDAGIDDALEKVRESLRQAVMKSFGVEVDYDQF